MIFLYIAANDNKKEDMIFLYIAANDNKKEDMICFECDICQNQAWVISVEHFIECTNCGKRMNIIDLYE